MIAALAIAGLVVAPTEAASASLTPATNLLRASSVLGPDQSLVSRDGDYRLTMGRDGNLVLFEHGKATWESGTQGHIDAFAELQRDGNFVIFAGREVLWQTTTTGLDNYLVVEDDGNVVIYDSGGKAQWSVNLPPTVQYGDSGPIVLTLQRRLSALGYWVGAPDGFFGDATQQAVWALQKASNLPRDGVVGSATWGALERGVVPVLRPASGDLIEVNLNLDLLMILRQGKLWVTLNTSTGGGYTYTDQGVTSVAITPQGIFHTYADIDGIDVDSLGTLWRPRFFYEGFAIHGDSYVPPYPVSHGCVRVSNEAIDWIWAINADPIGSEVWIYY